ncbi:hypothetical protein K3495_g6400 [Podosphaera aphanis]|nr:hypothetical protein K3495_g6400 [Podosphaera aphanis]
MLLFLLLTITAAVTGDYIPGKVFDRLISIWLENGDFNQTSEIPTIKSLAKQGILLTGYYGLTHPSQPNYLASVGGDYFGLDNDNFTRIPSNVSTIVDLLDTRNIDWRGYFEDQPGPGYMGPSNKRPDGKYDYVRKHNPFVSYDSITFNGSRLAKLLSFRDFDRDLASKTLAQVIHISPNMMNNGHNTSLTFATDWADSFLKPLLADSELMNRTLILLTYDESGSPNSPNQITSLLIGGVIPENLHGSTDATLYTHYSVLSTIENNWDLPCLGRYDVGANVFSFVASQTNYTNNPLADPGKVRNFISYPGFLNTDPKKYLPLPPPNLQLIGAGGNGVAEKIQKAWKTSADENTPYDGAGTLYDGGDGVTSAQLPIYKPQGPNPLFTPSPVGVSPVGTRKVSKASARSPGRPLDLHSLILLSHLFMLHVFNNYRHHPLS